MYCTYCGAELPDGARYCSRCGRLLPPAGSGGGAAGKTPVVERAPAETGGDVLRSNVAEFDATERSEGSGGYRPLLVEAPRPSVSGSYKHAWRQLWRRFFALFLVGLIYVLIELPMALVGNAIASSAGEGLGTLYDTGTGLFISVPLALGNAYAYLRAARGETPDVGDLFVPFKQTYVAGIFATLLYMVLVVVGTLALIVPGIIVGVRLSFYSFLIVDEQLGPVEALRESWRRTAGYGWTVFGVSILAIPIVLLGLLVLFVGVIPAMMLVELASASLFVAVSARDRV